MDNPDVWVGSWRPHRPRGPIAALYKGPGPKYGLPTTIGDNEHDPRKRKAPAFSFGTRHRDTSVNISPGPCYLIPQYMTRTGLEGNPAYSLHSRPKDPKLIQTPGPGMYCPEKTVSATFNSSPAYSLSPRIKPLSSDQTPGPAKYMLPPVMGPVSVCKKSAPSISMSGRTKKGSFYEDLKKTPGPGTYRTVDTNVYRKQSPQYSITGCNKMPGNRTKTPGPGAHFSEKVIATKPTAPSFSFGVHHSEYTAPLFVGNAD